MGVIQTSKNQDTWISDSINAEDRGKNEGKEPKATNLKPKENKRSSEGSSSSKKKKKFEKTKCPYCMRGFHPEI